MSHAPRLDVGGGARPRRGRAVDAARYDDERRVPRAILPPRRRRQLANKARSLSSLESGRVLWRRAHRTRVD